MTIESSALQGVWNITSLEVEGAVMSAPAFAGSQIVMTGDRFTTASMGAEYSGTFAIDSSVEPNQLDLNFTDGPHAGEKSPAIFKMEGGVLTICLAFAGGSRPADFTTAPGSGHALETLQRGTLREPDSTMAGVSESSGQLGQIVDEAEPINFLFGDAEEAARLQGEWAMVSGAMDGQTLPANFVHTGKRVVKGNVVTVAFGGQTFLKARITIDPHSSPRSMDYELLEGPNAGKHQFGIYEFDEGLLRVCSTPPGTTRPTEFESKPGDGRVLSVWRPT